MALTNYGPGLFIAPQICVADLEGLKQQGIAALICNRPDGEAPGQPIAADIAAAADRLGLKFRHVPVVPGRAGPDDLTAFRAALAELPRPLLAYCGSGMRSRAMLDAAGRAA